MKMVNLHIFEGIKCWLKPVLLAGSTRFSSEELRTLESLVAKNHDVILEAWNEHFSR